MKKIFEITKNNSKGAISVIVALSVLAIILTIGMSASYTVSGELAISGDASESTKAYYAAEAGIEKAMYERFRSNAGAGGQPTGSVCPALESTGDSKYCLVIAQDDAGDFSTITSIKSIGEYGSVRRSIEISF